MVMENFQPRGGHHCITNSLRQIFEFNSYPISEPMLFGLGFVYINLADSPMISGRTKLPEFEQNIHSRIGVKILTKSPKDYFMAFNSMKDLISRGVPVMAYVDMVYLEYLNLPPSSHFGGHSIVVFGFDDQASCFYVSDRDSKDWSIHTPKGKIAADFHKVSYEEMQRARSSSFRPFPANKKWVNIDFSQSRAINETAIYDSILVCTRNMLNPPANLLGINGIRKFAKEIKKWKAFNPDKFKRAGITNYFMINADGGTGGGAFRKMYGDFLVESSTMVNNQDMAACGHIFLRIGQLWDAVGLEMMNIFNTGDISIVDRLKEMILHIADKEEMELMALQSMVKDHS